jgi:effector-binding domain-containing protein
VIESVRVETLSEQHAAVVRGRRPPEEIGEFVGPAYAAVSAALAAQGIAIAGPPFCRYSVGEDEMNAEGQAEEFSMAVGFPTERAAEVAGEVEPMILPAGDAVVVVHVGAYPELGEAYAAGADWLREHDLEMSADPWETYLDGPDADPHHTVLRFPCRPITT